MASIFESCCPFSKQGRGSVFSTHFGSALILFYVVHTCCWLAACWWAEAHAAQRNPTQLRGRTKATGQSWKQSLTRLLNTEEADPTKSLLSFANKVSDVPNLPPNSKRNQMLFFFFFESLNPIGLSIVLIFFISFGTMNANMCKKKKKKKACKNQVYMTATLCVLTKRICTWNKPHYSLKISYCSPLYSWNFISQNEDRKYIFCHPWPPADQDSDLYAKTVLPRPPACTACA